MESFDKIVSYRLKQMEERMAKTYEISIKCQHESPLV